MVQRENVIEAKGKGKLQTYWLLLKGEGRNGDGASSAASLSDIGSVISSDTLDSGDFESSNRVSIPQEVSNSIITNLKISTAAEIQAALQPKISRLVKWNVEVLSRLLKKVVAKRNAIGNRRNYDTMLMIHEDELRKKYLVLDEVVEIIPLPAFDQHIHKRQEELAKLPGNQVELSDVVMDQLNLYVSCMAACHKKENSFHNFEHASHVMMSVSKLLSRIVAADDITDGSALGAHDHTYGIVSRCRRRNFRIWLRFTNPIVNCLSSDIGSYDPVYSCFGGLGTRRGSWWCIEYAIDKRKSQIGNSLQGEECSGTEFDCTGMGYIDGITVLRFKAMHLYRSE